MVNIPFFHGFYTSQVVQDFFHCQQYVQKKQQNYITAHEMFEIGIILLVPQKNHMNLIAAKNGNSQWNN